MKNVFIINPKAGNGKYINKLKNEIVETAEKLKADADIYFTKTIGDATEFVKKYCEKFGAARFIACGGDGTLSEVVNGAVEFENAEIGLIPIGTGNDFCRNFNDEQRFFNVAEQLTVKPQKCDVIKYTTEIEDNKISGYCINMFNIGFDCNVADMTNKIKRKRFVTGTIAYLISIFAILIKKKGADNEYQKQYRKHKNIRCFFRRGHCHFFFVVIVNRLSRFFGVGILRGCLFFFGHLVKVYIGKQAFFLFGRLLYFFVLMGIIV